jgi:hypothetical protein
MTGVGRAAILAIVGAIVAAVALQPVPALAAADEPDLKTVIGVYLGRAVVKDLPSDRTEEREIDVEIQPFRSTGFRMRWTNVTLVNGRRDVRGVTRRVTEVTFLPGEGRGFFVEAPERDVFSEREEVAPLGGDTIRWAVLDARGLTTYAFVVLNDGRYELQTYTRRLAGEELELRYERVVDGERLRTIEGRAIKVQ